MAGKVDPELILDSYVRADARSLTAVDTDPEHRRRFDFPEDFIPSVQHAERVIERWAEERRAGTRFRICSSLRPAVGRSPRPRR